MNRAHLERILNSLDRERQVNHRLAVDEPANDFENTVNEWHELSTLLAHMKSLIKPLEAEERKFRDAISDSLRAFYAAELKEGMNNYELSNGRKLKFGHKVDRKVETSMVGVAREEYAKAPVEGVPFDAIIRVKYELEARQYKKTLTSPAALAALGRMITTKFAAPTLEVD